MENTNAAYGLVTSAMALRDDMRHGDDPLLRLLSFRLHRALPELLDIARVISEREMENAK